MILRMLLQIALCAVIHLTVFALHAADPAPVPLPPADIERNVIVATVNDQPITAAEVTGETLVAERAFEAARKATLEKLIDKALLVQAFKERKYVIPPEFVQEQIRAIVNQNFNGDQSKFEEVLKKQNYTVEEFEQRQENDIMARTMRTAIAGSVATAAAKKQAVETWLAEARAKAAITYK